MKRILPIAFLLLIGNAINSQTICVPPIYSFNNKSNVTGSGAVGTVYRFNSTILGGNTFVTVTKLQNATITNNNMDVAGSFPLAWQPTINFTNATSSGDSSYVEFNFKFVETGLGATLNLITNKLLGQKCMAMTVVDVDGPGNSNTYREMVKVAQPATPVGIKNSTIAVTQNSRWVNLISGTAQFSNIDTANYGAMAQLNFPPDTKEFTIRVGVVGTISANSSREFSFYFKNFNGLNFVLPVHLIDFNASLNNSVAQLNWSTASEQNSNRFEVYKSYDGLSFELAGVVNAAGNSNELKTYGFIDTRVTGYNQPSAYYQLKMIDNNGNSEWSKIVKVRLNGNVSNGIVSVFPNPSNATLNVDVTNFQVADLKLEIVDVFGKSVQTVNNPEANNGSIALDVATLPKGMYFIRLTSNEGSEATSIKFIKE